MLYVFDQSLRKSQAGTESWEDAGDVVVALLLTEPFEGRCIRLSSFRYMHLGIRIWQTKLDALFEDVH